MQNLTTAFPEKLFEEKKVIAKQFYKNFTDNFIETLKLISASKRFLQNHFVVDNPSVFEKYYQENRKVQLHLGHTFNWELANVCMPYWTRHQFLVVYMPLKNKVFNRLLMHLRSRTGTVLLPATNMSKAILPFRNELYMLTLVADQAPGSPDNAYWLPFFGRPTPFVRAPERGAQIGDLPVIFGSLYKTKRGHYHAVLEVGADHPALLPQGELTRRYIAFMEKNIRQHPELYLWTHRRWKHQWKSGYEKKWIGTELPPTDIKEMIPNS